MWDQKQTATGAWEKGGEMNAANISIATVTEAMRAYNREVAPGSECNAWQDYIDDCVERYDATPWVIAECKRVIEEDFADYWMEVACRRSPAYDVDTGARRF